MKKIIIYQFAFVLLVTVLLSSCYKLQKDYQYNPAVLDPNINMTAMRFMDSRGNAGVGADTIFKLMQQGIQYAGIDTTEYTKAGRTYIFLYNSAIRTSTGTGATFKVTGGFFFDYPIVVKDALGVVIKSKIDPSADSMRPAVTWNEYPQAMVKNYLLYLILQGDYTFENLSVTNTSIQTLLPAGAKVDPKDSKLGWVVTKTLPNPDVSLATAITLSPTAGTGFDPEGKINLKLFNGQNGQMTLNDRIDDRSAGYFATNGKVHVFDKTIHPFRYSYP